MGGFPIKKGLKRLGDADDGELPALKISTMWLAILPHLLKVRVCSACRMG